MKILYVSHYHANKNTPPENIGGMQRVSAQLLNTLQNKENIQVDKVIQYSRANFMLIRTIIFWFRLVLTLPFVVLRKKPDVIFFTSIATSSVAPIVRHFMDVPMVTLTHGNDVISFTPYWYKHIYLPWIFRSMDGVVSVSEATRNECLGMGVKPEKSVALPNGINPEDWDGDVSEKESREKLEKLLGINLKAKYILLSVGRQVKRKGHVWFIENVLPKVKNDVVYVVIGDGSEHENIQKVTMKNSKKNQIFLLGRQSDEILKQAYHAADLFIMPNIPIPNDMEGFGIVMIEANACGTPAIASKLQGIKDVITNGKNGYLVEPLDAEAFAKRIDSTLNNDLEGLRKSSAEFARRYFNWDYVADKYITEFKNFKKLRDIKPNFRKRLTQNFSEMISRYTGE